MRRSLFTLILLLCALQAVAYTPRQQRIYLFGFAASFTDSVAYITDIQTLDSAYVHPNGFLADRMMYGAQLNYYMENTLHLQHMTCVVLFSKSKSKLEKKYLKIKKKYVAEHAVSLKPLGRDVFQFKLEEWVDPEVTETPVVPETKETKPEKTEPKAAPHRGPGIGGTPPTR